jgi:hypothetical protein
MRGSIFFLYNNLLPLHASGINTIGVIPIKKPQIIETITCGFCNSTIFFNIYSVRACMGLRRGY